MRIQILLLSLCLAVHGTLPTQVNDSDASKRTLSLSSKKALLLLLLAGLSMSSGQEKVEQIAHQERNPFFDSCNLHEPEIPLILGDDGSEMTKAPVPDDCEVDGLMNRMNCYNFTDKDDDKCPLGELTNQLKENFVEKTLELEAEKVKPTEPTTNNENEGDTMASEQSKSKEVSGSEQDEQDKDAEQSEKDTEPEQSEDGEVSESEQDEQDKDAEQETQGQSASDFSSKRPIAPKVQNEKEDGDESAPPVESGNFDPAINLFWKLRQYFP